MENIHTCRWCRKIYRGFGEHFCPECVQKMDDAFVTVRAYLDDHPAANATEVVRETGLEERIVMQLLKDERLSEYSNGTNRCEVCYKGIRSGKLCKDCQQMMEKFMRSHVPGDTARPGNPAAGSGRTAKSSIARTNAVESWKRDADAARRKAKTRTIRVYDD